MKLAQTQGNLFQVPPGGTAEGRPAGDKPPIADWAQGFRSQVQAARTLGQLLEGNQLAIFPPPPKDSKRPPYNVTWIGAPTVGWPVVPRAWVRARFKAGHLEQLAKWPNGKVILQLTESGRAWAQERVGRA